MYQRRSDTAEGSLVYSLLGNDTICFVANVQDDLIFFDIDDRALYDFSISDCFYVNLPASVQNLILTCS